MFKRLFWRIVKGIADKWFQKKIDGDKPKPAEPPAPDVYKGRDSEGPFIDHGPKKRN